MEGIGEDKNDSKRSTAVWIDDERSRREMVTELLVNSTEEVLRSTDEAYGDMVRVTERDKLRDKRCIDVETIRSGRKGTEMECK